LLHFEHFRFALYRRQGGRAPELESADTLQWMGRLLARMHGIGARTRFGARGTLDRATLVAAPSRAVLASPLLPAAVRDRYARTITQLDRLIAARFAGAVQSRNCVCMATVIGNVLWTDAGRTSSIWTTRMGRRGICGACFGAMNSTHCSRLRRFRDFDRRELVLVEPLRLMRQIHYAGWIAQRWDDPAFPLAFPFAAEPRWWGSTSTICSRRPSAWASVRQDSRMAFALTGRTRIGLLRCSETRCWLPSRP
jgi:Ser/Thr protein kinase RdoA (MazF antagonist)